MTRSATDLRVVLWTSAFAWLPLRADVGWIWLERYVWRRDEAGEIVRRVIPWEE